MPSLTLRTRGPTEFVIEHGSRIFAVGGKNLDKGVSRVAHIPGRYRIDYRTKIAGVSPLMGI
jgi:hypothetical protein